MAPADTITIDGRAIGPGHRPYIVAEMSANHLGDFDRAHAIISAAAEAGADAIKLQTYTADTLTIAHEGPGFRIEGGLWRGRTLHDLYDQAHLPWAWHEALFAHGRALGLTVFSAAFDASAVAFLEGLGTPVHKIASFELVDLPLIGGAAATRKPLILSTGMATLCEIHEAVATARASGCCELLLLHCVSGYPAPAADYRLHTIPHLNKAFGVPVGLSDHTKGTVVAAAAVALGAVMIEKHLTLARADGGPDAAFSLEPHELRSLVAAAREAWAACTEADCTPAPSEADMRRLRRSLYVMRDMGAGEVFTADTVRSIRPGHGLAPRHLPEVLGRSARVAIARGTPLNWPMIAAGG